MTGPVVHSQISDVELQVGDHLDAVASPAAGAVATFVGRVRDHDPSVTGTVTGLEYSAHPDAAEVLDRLARAAAARSGVIAVAVSHRIGTLQVGETAIVAAVSTAHRRLAFEVCADLVEQVKAELPVWKRELLADGSALWIGL